MDVGEVICCFSVGKTCCKCFVVQSLDGDFFDKMRGYFTTLGQLEVDACKNAMDGFETIVSQANTVGGYFIFKCSFVMVKKFIRRNYFFDHTD